MSELGSLYSKLGEPEGELCGCTCEVGDWAAKYIADLIEQRDKLLAALTEIAELDILKYHHAYAIAKGAIEEIAAKKGGAR